MTERLRHELDHELGMILIQKEEVERSMADMATDVRAWDAIVARRFARIHARMHLWSGWFEVSTKTVDNLPSNWVDLLRDMVSATQAMVNSWASGATDSGGLNSTNSWVRLDSAVKMEVYAGFVRRWSKNLEELDRRVQSAKNS